jgi:hypothetical protein
MVPLPCSKRNIRWFRNNTSLIFVQGLAAKQMLCSLTYFLHFSNKKNSAIASGATTLGSASRAPDRKKNLIRNLTRREEEEDLSKEETKKKKKKI